MQRGSPLFNKSRLDSATLVLVLTFLFLAFNLGKALFLYGGHALAALAYPYPLAYGEGPLLDQVLRLASGENIYRNSFATPPYTVTNDPPLFMALQVPFTRLFGMALWYGRGISILCLLITALFLGLTLYQLTADPIAAIVSGLLLFSVPYFVNWSVYDRSDTLALALSWVGLFALVRWPDRRSGLVLAGLFFTAAIYTNQAYVLAAPLTALAWLLQKRRARAALALLIGLAAAVLLLFLALNFITRGGFLLNTITGNVYPWDSRQAAGRYIEIGIHAFYLGLIAILFLLSERLSTPTRSWPFVLPYLCAAVLISAAAGRAGAGDNALYELAAALCLVAGAALAWLRNKWARAVLVLLVALQVSFFVSWTNLEYEPTFKEKFAVQTEVSQLAAIVRQTDGVMLADEYMGLLPLAGRRLYYQPFEYAQLAQAGLWDPAPLIKDLQEKKFPALLIYWPADFHITLSRWPGDIYQVLWNNYKIDQTLADTWVLYPRK
jgi:hypothetical protein